jgi:hypothetical protein
MAAFLIVPLDSAGWLATVRLPSGSRSAALPVAPSAELPLPRRAEMAVARAQTLAAAGHLTDALVALDMVRATDPQRADADRLRSDIQRQLLALTAIPARAEPSKEDRRIP